MGLAKVDSGTGQQKTKTVPGINVTMSMFFDGTGNNKNNTDARAAANKMTDKNQEKKTAYEQNTDHKSSSYENDYSNVARLWKNFTENQGKYVLKYYVEGIGTENLKADDSKGTATGSGNTGVPARIKKSCQWMADKLNTLAKNKNTHVIDNLIIDVFGFSRGAAAARHFIYEVTKAAYKAESVTTYIPGGEFSAGETITSYKDDMHNPTDFTEFPMRGYLGAYCKNYQLQINNVVIRFAGLFDCVASYNQGLFLPGMGSDTASQFKKNTAELHLNAVALARKVIHFTAADEHRGNFPLTTIASAGNKGQSFSLPGVHSDVGGCYIDNMNEIETDIDSGSDIDMETEQQGLIAQGWYNKDELTTTINSIYDTPIFELSGHRKSVRNTYSFIPLHFMCRHAIEFTKKNTPDNVIPFDQGKIEDPSSNTSIKGDKLLEAINTILEKQVFENGPPLVFKNYKDVLNQHNATVSSPKPPGANTEMANQQNLRLLRHGYLHWNANYDTVYGVLHPMYPRLVNNHTERLILPG
jgi:hypothetical protein